jgi:type IV secretion system protein VirB10
MKAVRKPGGDKNPNEEESKTVENLSPKQPNGSSGNGGEKPPAKENKKVDWRKFIKKYAKFVIGGSVAIFLIYQIFLSGDDGDQKKIDQIKQNSPQLQTQSSGDETEKKSNTNKEINPANIDSKNKPPVPQAPKLESPDLPDIPNLFDGKANKDVNDNSSAPPLPNDIFADNNGKDKESSPSQINTNVNDVKVDNGKTVTSVNGIPIISYDDLTVDQARRMDMFVISGSGPNQPQGGQSQKSKSIDDFIFVNDFEKKARSKDQDKNTAVTRGVGGANSISQGKVISITLETAINSQLPGVVRGIVSEDVYGDVGSNVLVPKGSRVFGSYSAQILQLQSRLNITWNRVLRPDGVVLSLTSQVADKIGRAGIEGDVDTRMADILTTSLMLSLIPIGTALALEQINGGNVAQSQTTNPSLGTVTTSGITPFSSAAQNLTQTTANFVQNNIPTSITPVVHVPQGERVSAFIVQDIPFIPTYKTY